MRLHNLALGFALMGGLAVPAPAGEKAKPSDEQITKSLTGTWTTCVTGGTSATADGTICYKPDGTFLAKGKVKLGDDMTADVQVEGTWKVAAGTVVLKAVKSSHPGLAPVGAEMKEVILAIDAEKMTFKRGVGQERSRKRVEG